MWGVAATVVAAALVLAGCTGTPAAVVTGSAVVVASEEMFTSTNTSTAYGNSAINRSLAYATNAGFSYYNSDGELVADTSFGSIRKLSDDPLVVRYTVADGVTWSDGTPVDATDLLLAWAAGSGIYNDPGVDPVSLTDPITGDLGTVPAGLVYFDSRATNDGLARVTAFPEVSEDNLSITMHYDSVYADWQKAFWSPTSPGLPAHVVGRHALGAETAGAAKDAVRRAIAKDDRVALAKISQEWNNGFTVVDMPSDVDQLVSTGPYTITDVLAGQYVVLTANKNYHGERQPKIEQLTVRTVSDPVASVQAMLGGALQVITPTPSPEVVQALGEISVTTATGYRDVFEHLDLVAANSASGAFDDQRVREAFLKVVPRTQIVTDLIGPVQPDATTRDSYLFMPGTKDYRTTVTANGSKAYADVDVPGAVALLEAAGATSPTVCILFDPKDARRAAEFTLVANSAAQAGFVVTNCSSDDWKTRLGTPQSYDAVLYGSPAATSSTQLTATFSTQGSENFTSYSNPDVDGLLAKLAVELDPAQHTALLRQLDAVLWSDGYGAPLFQNVAITAYDQKRVTNVSPSATPAGVFWNVWDWAPVYP